MEDSKQGRVKRSQRDYTLAFKLSVVKEVEKAALLISRHSADTGYRAEVQFWYGYQKKAFRQAVRELQQERKINLSCACRLFGISRQAIYKRENAGKKRAVILTQVKAMVRTQRMAMPRIGTRKLYFLLGDQLRSLGLKIGRDGLPQK